ncbi:MAG: hypothetical protein AAF570_29395, partial [Bacteroidota bacterium]
MGFSEFGKRRSRKDSAEQHACKGSATDDEIDQLKIVRPEPSLPKWEQELKMDWEKLESGFYRRRFKVPPNIFRHVISKRIPDDPFAELEGAIGVEAQEIWVKDAQKILEEAGIEFEPGTSAKYDRDTGTIVVVQIRDVLHLIDAYLYTPCGMIQKQLTFRAEIYELPTMDVLQLVESSGSQGEHTPERTAALEAVKAGHGKLVAFPSAIGRSGQRSLTQNGVEVPKIGKDQAENEGDS